MSETKTNLIPIPILIAEDEQVSRRVLLENLKHWGFDVIATENGEEALAALELSSNPQILVLDWMMPKMDGLEVIHRIRAEEKYQSLYIIMLTAKGQQEDIVTALDAGANDYMTKPFHASELKARIGVAIRVIGLQNTLADKVCELEEALERVQTLHGLMPICSYCKRIRNDNDYWQQIEHYITEHSEAEFSHGICPDCYEEHMAPQLKASGADKP